jgi:hypothetical protein
VAAAGLTAETSSGVGGAPVPVAFGVASNGFEPVRVGAAVAVAGATGAEVAAATGVEAATWGAEPPLLIAIIVFAA